MVDDGDKKNQKPDDEDNYVWANDSDDDQNDQIQQQPKDDAVMTNDEFTNELVNNQRNSKGPMQDEVLDEYMHHQNQVNSPSEDTNKVPMSEANEGQIFDEIEWLKSQP